MGVGSGFLQSKESGSIPNLLFFFYIKPKSKGSSEIQFHKKKQFSVTSRIRWAFLRQVSGQNGSATKSQIFFFAFVSYDDSIPTYMPTVYSTAHNVL